MWPLLGGLARSTNVRDTTLMATDHEVEERVLQLIDYGGGPRGAADFLITEAAQRKRPGTASCLAGLAERPLPGAWLTLESEGRGTVPDPQRKSRCPNWAPESRLRATPSGSAPAEGLQHHVVGRSRCALPAKPNGGSIRHSVPADPRNLLRKFHAIGAIHHCR